MNEIMVSVVCDVFNHEDYLRECLDGIVMQQTNFAFEILIHDDASTDKSVEIIQEYVDKYPHLFKPIYQKENKFSKGISIWKDIQFPRAQGKYIAICEGDDYWTDPYKLQKQVDFLEANPEYSMCFHGAEIKNETDTKVITTCQDVEDKEYFTNDIFPGWVVPTASVVYRRSTINSFHTLKQTHWMKYGDIVLFLKCTHTGRVWGMKEKMSVYRMTTNGAVVSQCLDPKSEEKVCNHYRFLMMNFPQLDKKWPSEYIAQYYYTKFRNIKKMGFKLRYLFVALRFSPCLVFDKLYSAITRI